MTSGNAMKRERTYDYIVSRSLAIWTSLSVSWTDKDERIISLRWSAKLTSDTSVDESRVDLLAILPSKTHTRKLSWDVILYEDICFLDQLINNL